MIYGPSSPQDEHLLPGVWEVPGGGIDQGETIAGMTEGRWVALSEFETISCTSDIMKAACQAADWHSIMKGI